MTDNAISLYVRVKTTSLMSGFIVHHLSFEYDIYLHLFAFYPNIVRRSALQRLFQEHARENLCTEAPKRLIRPYEDDAPMRRRTESTGANRLNI